MSLTIRNLFITTAAISTATFIAACGDDDQADTGRHGDSAAAHHAGAADHHDNAGGHAHGPEAGGHTNTTRLVFSSQPAELPVGQSATWTLKIVDAASGAPIDSFATVHEKLLHLIIVSTDLSWFNHIHPEYRGHGEFTVNTVLPRAGTYKLYADYTPAGGGQEIAQHEMATAGAQAGASATPLTADTIGAGGWMLKKVTAAPEGEPEKRGGAQYEVAMMPMPRAITAGKDVMLHFQVRDQSGKPLEAIEPYLGALGHAVILSSDTKVYLHTHPMDGDMEGMDHGSMQHGAAADSTAGAAKKGRNSDVMFHTNFPEPGLYKVWGQFQHKGLIVAASFVVNVGPKAS